MTVSDSLLISSVFSTFYTLFSAFIYFIYNLSNFNTLEFHMSYVSLAVSVSELQYE